MAARPSLARLLIVLALTLTLATPVSAVERFGPSGPALVSPPTAHDAYVPDQLVVRFDASMSPAARAQLLSGEHARVKRELLVPGLALVELPAGADVPAAAAAWQHRPGVAFAEPNFVYQLSAKPNDPRFDELWGLDNPTDNDIDAPEAWDITTGSANVIVAVVDSGVDYTHPDLSANIWANPGETIDGKDNDGNGLVDDVRGWDFVGNDNDPMDQRGHGTHIAGTIGAKGNNGAGITGVNWNVRMMAVRAGNAAGNFSNADITDSFTYACNQGARVINGSFGGPNSSQAIRHAIEACPQALFVVAAGNDGSNNDASAVYPCNYTAENIVCVAASGKNADLAGFSNFGPTNVDLTAPGTSILSAAFKRILFKDGFESGLGKWTPNKVSGKSWSRTTEAASGGVYSATDSAGSDYANNSNTWLETSSPISLAGATYCELAYTYLIDTELNYDGMTVEASKNGGASWTGLTGWTGVGTGRDTVDLKAKGFDGTASFDLRFRLTSDYSNVYDGVYVDDVMVQCHPASYGSNDYVSDSGTSMAAPHVSGVAALVLAAHPNLNTASVKQAILDGVQPRGPLSGLVATGGRLNALGALQAVETTKPVAVAPTQRLVNNATLTPSEARVRVSWEAATDAAPSSGILKYQLQQRKRSKGVWGAWTTVKTTSALAATVKLPSGTYKFRVRAQDRAGNWSGWKPGSPFLLNASQDAAITYGGTWSTNTSADFFGGSSRHTGVRGRTALYSFTGTEVAWVAVRGPNRGTAKVYIDGALVKTVDLYATTFKYRRVVFLKRWTTDGKHTIQIKVTVKDPASSGSRVDLDAYLTLD